MAAKQKKKDSVGKLVAENRRARYDYEIEDTVEAGVMLVGTEVKALREGRANIAEAYASDEADGIYLINSHFPEYAPAARDNHQPRRPRKLLLHKREIQRLSEAVQRKGYTLTPLKLYFNDKGRVKLLLGLGKGKKHQDKRETEKKRDWQRDKARLMRERG
ncbi:MAG: SsrA-binding protein SmpB [Pseudomonadota bacterium]